MVDAALLELEGVVFDTRDLRRLSLRDALLEHGLSPAVDHEAVDGWTPRVGVERSLALQGIKYDEVLIDIVTARAERAFSTRLATSGAAFCDHARAFVENAAGSARLAIVTNARRGAKRDMIRDAVNRLPNRFRYADLERALPAVSRPTIARALRELRVEGAIRCVKPGRDATWEKTPA